jgi:hypothetical protein
MPRFRDINSGAVVSVRDDKVMGSGWEIIPDPKPTKSDTARKSTKSD